MTSDEKWLPIVGYEGVYEVSDQGRVRSLDRMVYAGSNRVRLSLGRILSIHHGDKYAKVRLKLDGTGKTHNVHTLVATAFLGLRPDGMEVCHCNGQPHDNRLTNLRYDTHQANVLERRDHGTAFTRRDQSECYHGHLYADGTFYVDSDSGKRVCLICDAERGARRRAQERESAGRTHRRDLTHCKSGHPFDGHNGRQKTCSVCAIASQARYQAKRKARRDTPNA